MKTFLKYLSKFLVFAFVILSITLLCITLFRPEWIKIALKWIEGLIEHLRNWNYLIAFSAALIESIPVIGGFFPGMNIMILVGGFWGSNHLILTILCASFGAMLGNYFGYWIGCKYGRHIIKNYGDYIGIGTTEQKILEKQIEKNGFWYIVLGKFHGFLRAFIPFVAGMSKMEAKNFWTYNMIGSIIWAISINLLGVYFIDKYEVILDNFGKITTGILVVIIGYLFLFKKEALKKYWHDKDEEMRQKYQK